MHHDALTGEAGAEVGIGVGIHPHSRSIGRHERSLVDAELDGAKFGGSEFGLVLRPRPSRLYVRRLVRPFSIPWGLGRALGPTDGVLGEGSPFRPAPPLDLIVTGGKEGPDADLA